MRSVSRRSRSSGPSAPAENQSGRRRETWLLAAAGFVGFSAAHVLDDRAETSVGHLGLVAGWLVVVLALAEVVRSRREQRSARERSASDEQRLLLAQELRSYSLGLKQRLGIAADLLRGEASSLAVHAELRHRRHRPVRRGSRVPRSCRTPCVPCRHGHAAAVAGALV